MSGVVDLPVAGLAYLGGVVWTLIYDTIYAHQVLFTFLLSHAPLKDKKDDMLVGVKSTALAWGENTKKYCRYLNAVSLACFGCAGYAASVSFFYYIALALSHYHQQNLINNVDLNDGESCMNTFVAMRYVGYLITISIIIGRYFEDSDDDILDVLEEVGEELGDSDD